MTRTNVAYSKRISAAVSSSNGVTPVSPRALLAGCSIALFLAALLSASPLMASSEPDRRAEPLETRATATSSGFFVETGLIAYDFAVLRVVSDKGELFRGEFEAGTEIDFSSVDELEDGGYRWEVLVWEKAEGRSEWSERTPESDDPNIVSQSASWRSGGSFDVRQGLVTVQPVRPPRGSAPENSSDAATDEIEGGGSGLQTKTSAAANHNVGSLSASGNACLGDTLCSAAHNPTEDLEILDGGARALIRFRDNTIGETQDWAVGTDSDHSFGISDALTNGFNNPSFKIEQGAPVNGVVIDSQGRVGIGTDAPAENIHIAGDSMPYIRLDNGTNIWDLRSNSGFAWLQNDNLFPFVVAAGAPSSSFRMDSSGRIGIGTPAPSSTVEIEGTSGTSQFLIDEQGADANVEVMFNLVCNCAPGFRMQNTVNGEIWFFRHTSAGDFSFDNVGSAGLEARLDPNGNFFIQGSLSQGSSRALKENLEPADGHQVLAILDQLDLYEWSYLDQGARHFGPMAEEFSAAFGLGESKAKIAPSDMAGVAMASVKALREENVELKTVNAEQQRLLRSLLERVEALERVQD